MYLVNNEIFCSTSEEVDAIVTELMEHKPWRDYNFLTVREQVVRRVDAWGQSLPTGNE